MTEREKLEMRQRWTQDLEAVIDRNKYPDIHERARKVARNAMADVIALDDPTAAETHRRLDPPF